MTWLDFVKVKLKDEWVYTSPVEGTYFRISHGDYPSNGSFSISQFDENGKVFGHTIIKASLFSEVLYFPKPKLASNRKLGLKLISAIPWEVTIEISDYVESNSSDTPGIFSLVQDAYNEILEISNTIENTLLVDTYTLNNKLDLLIEKTTQNRKVISITTPVIPPGGIYNTTILLGRTFLLLSLLTSSPAWVRLYTTPAYRASDANRLISQNPNNLENGIISEDITTSLDLSIDLSGNGGFQGVGSSQELPPSSEIAIAIVNTSSSPQAITITYNRIIIES